MPSDVESILSKGSIAELQQAYAARSLSVEEAVGWYQNRIDQYNAQGGRLNAVRTISSAAIEIARARDRERANGSALGPLHGVPVLLKDNILTKESMPASGGAAALANFVPRREATLVSRLRDAGAVILGKTNMTEFADYVSDVMPSGFSGAGGVVRNPHGMDYGRGLGSSVGSAAAVAANFAPIAIGSETQNSIQTPACVSSVFGFKPSVGGVSRAGVIPLVTSQDSPGPLTRCVEDAALVWAAICGPDCRDAASLARRHLSQPRIVPRPLSLLRIGAPRRTIADRADLGDAMPAFERALSMLSEAGARIVDPCDLPSAEQVSDLRSCVFRTEFKVALNAFLEDNDSPCGMGSLDDIIRWNEAHPDAIPYGQSLLLAANGSSGLNDGAYRFDRARDIALTRGGGIDAALASADVDVLIAPMGAAAKYTGKAGAPVIAIPIGLGVSGAPVGLTVFASFGEDALLVGAAAAIAAAVGDRVLPNL